MSRHDEKYEGLEERAKRGEYQLVAPLDFKILGFLHEEGATFAGLYPIGDTVRALSKRFTGVKGGLDTKIITTRLRILHIQGIVQQVTSVGSGAHTTLWQRTALGSELLRNWKATDGKDEPSDA